VRTKLPEQTGVAPSLEKRIAVLEQDNAATQKNFTLLQDAFNRDLPNAFKAQDEATRTAIVALDGSIATLRKHAEGFHQLLDLLDGRLTRLEILLGSRKDGTIN
jgi:hypothetical protein